MIETLVMVVVYLLILGAVVGLLMFLVDYVPVPHPFNRWAKVVIMVGAVLIIIFLLLGVAGHGPGLRLR